jgi:hypothetical protein
MHLGGLLEGAMTGLRLMPLHLHPVDPDKGYFCRLWQ